MHATKVSTLWKLCPPSFQLITEMAAASNSGAAAGTRWDRVRLNRLIGSIPVAPMLALAGSRVTRGKPGDAFSSISGLTPRPAALLLQPLTGRHNPG
jgi:hypothetical protein